LLEGMPYSPLRRWRPTTHLMNKSRGCSSHFIIWWKIIQLPQVEKSLCTMLAAEWRH
jgi:hypothetical protein